MKASVSLGKREDHLLPHRPKSDAQLKQRGRNSLQMVQPQLCHPGSLQGFRRGVDSDFEHGLESKTLHEVGLCHKRVRVVMS